MNFMFSLINIISYHINKKEKKLTRDDMEDESRTEIPELLGWGLANWYAQVNDTGNKEMREQMGGRDTALLTLVDRPTRKKDTQRARMTMKMDTLISCLEQLIQE